MLKIRKIRGKIELLTGLHIGRGDDTMRLGGIDNSVIRHVNPNQNGIYEPYIPGSSLKGKMRTLLEWHLGLVRVGRKYPYEEGQPFSRKFLNREEIFMIDPKKREEAETFLKLFGDPTPDSPYGMTRISVGDCLLSESSKHMVLSEAKYENMVDRKKGTAQNPRQVERVPAGVSFNLDIRIKIFDELDDEEQLLNMVKLGLYLVEEDYLGGNGSRGYGRVKFHLSE
jgi:CRISPR-associated protein Csm3